MFSLMKAKVLLCLLFLNQAPKDTMFRASTELKLQPNSGDKLLVPTVLCALFEMFISIFRQKMGQICEICSNYRLDSPLY